MRQTASQAYQAKRKLVNRQIAILEERLQELDIVQEIEPKNWAIVGNLSQVHDQLSQVLDLLSDDIEDMEPF